MARQRIVRTSLGDKHLRPMLFKERVFPPSEIAMRLQIPAQILQSSHTPQRGSNGLLVRADMPFR